MFGRNLHLDDHEFLLAADTALPPRRQEYARRHLSACPPCAARLETLQRGLNVTIAEWHGADERSLPPISIARARLRLRLRELADGSRNEVPERPWSWAFVAMAAVVLLAAFGWPLAAYRAGSIFGNSNTTALRPRGDLTPGAVRAVTLRELCANDGLGHGAAIPASVQAQIFERYGADIEHADHYELDYLITPELGGAADAANLWPQPYSGTKWNAYVKDELEREFHRLTCEGSIDLATAQRELAIDWIAAYKRHFNTDVPRRDYTRAPLTADDADMLRAELDELGIAVPAGGTDGPTLMAMLQAARSPR